MTGALDSIARKLSYRLVNKFGKTIIIRRTARRPYDPENPAPPNDGAELAPVDYPLAVTPPKDFAYDKIDRTLVQKGDQLVMLPALNCPVVPNEDTDPVIYDGSEWVIRQLGYLYSGELVALYILHLGH